MDIFFLFLPAVIVLGNYLFSDLRDESAPARVAVQSRVKVLMPCGAS